MVVSENVRKQFILLYFLGIFNLRVCSMHLLGASGFVTLRLCVLSFWRTPGCLFSVAHRKMS